MKQIEFQGQIHEFPDGVTEDQIRQALSQYAPKETEAQPNALFPSASQVEGEGFKANAKRAGLGLMDLLGAPKRALATVRGQSMNDPDAYLLRPETEKAVASAKEALAKRPDAKNIPVPMGGFAMGMMPTAEMVPALTEVGGQIASDPLSLMGLFTKGAEFASSKLKSAGAKVYESALKPSKALVQKKGLVPEQILEKGYGGNFNKGLAKLEGDLGSLSDEVEGIASNAAKNRPHATLDLTQSLARARKNMAGELMQGEHGGLQDDIAKGGQQWAEDLSNRPLGVTDPLTALKYQRGVGAMGKWDKGLSPNLVPPKARVANEFYQEIGADLADVVPEIAPLRKEQSLRIPMRQALEDAAARTGKNNAISLTDAIALTGSAAGVSTGGAKGGIPGMLFGAVNKASKSPQVGNFLYQQGKSLSEESMIRDALKRALLHNVFNRDDADQNQ